MKKTIIASVFALAFIFSFTHFAYATSCTDPGQSCGNGNPAMVVGGWGTTNSEVPSMTQGQVAIDDNGISATCQFASGCVNVFHTTWYAQMISNLHVQLGDTLFQKWISLIKTK